MPVTKILTFAGSSRIGSHNVKLAALAAYYDRVATLESAFEAASQSQSHVIA